MLNPPESLLFQWIPGDCFLNGVIRFEVSLELIICSIILAHIMELLTDYILMIESIYNLLLRYGVIFEQIALLT